MAHFQWQGSHLLLHCYVQPKGSSDEIVGRHNDRLKIRITAPPVDGKANIHLCKFMATLFGVAKSHVTLVRGETGRQKTLSIKSPLKLPKQAAITPMPQ